MIVLVSLIPRAMCRRVPLMRELFGRIFSMWRVCWRRLIKLKKLWLESPRTYKNLSDSTSFVNKQELNIISKFIKHPPWSNDTDKIYHSTTWKLRPYTGWSRSCTTRVIVNSPELCSNPNLTLKPSNKSSPPISCVNNFYSNK